MKEIEIVSKFTVYTDIHELPAEVRELMFKAIELREQAYAPYSKFKVGAALLLENGEVVSGNNQENAAYPSGLCAERVAIFHAGAHYPNQQILKLAVTATSENAKVETPVPPCGACRQAIAQYEIKQKAPIEIYFMGETGNVIKSGSLKDLLPLLFDGSLL